VSVIKMDSLFVVVEDDFEWCPDAIVHLQRILLKNSRDIKNNFSAIRFSYGLNGVLLQCRDVRPLFQYLLSKHHDYPIDWMLAMFWTKTESAGKKYYHDRKFYTYRYNLLRHIGLQVLYYYHCHLP